MDLNTEFEKSDSDGDEGMEEGEFYTYDFDKKIWRFPGPAGRFPTRDSRVKVADLGFDEFKATQAWKEILSVDVGNAKRVHIRTVILNTAKVRIWKEGYIVARIKIMNHDPKRPTLVLEDETGTHLAMMSEDVLTEEKRLIWQAGATVILRNFGTITDCIMINKKCLHAIKVAEKYVDHRESSVEDPGPNHLQGVNVEELFSQFQTDPNEEPPTPSNPINVIEKVVPSARAGPSHIPLRDAKKLLIEAQAKEALEDSMLAMEGVDPEEFFGIF